MFLYNPEQWSNFVEEKLIDDRKNPATKMCSLPKSQLPLKSQSS